MNRSAHRAQVKAERRRRHLARVLPWQRGPAFCGRCGVRLNAPVDLCAGCASLLAGELGAADDGEGN